MADQGRMSSPTAVVYWLQMLRQTSRSVNSRKAVPSLSWMLCKHGLRQCVQSNVLTTPVIVWDDIFESDLFSVAYQHSGDPRWPVRYLFTEVYEVTTNPPDVLDQNSTNENDSDVLSLSSLTNEPLINGSIRNNVCHPRSTRERESSSEGSVNTHTHVSIQRQGSRTPLRIPRPPRKPAPSSCKGSSSDPLTEHL
ncbi:basic helix-loop-helix (bHLH) DNA-bindingsuperfamily protein [Striga asiatica]|uniref:Basic helix-loop-helix (BHLH) DNA-bindingsuperfamily protein n=1 Tax=Striga asiatica TaxID=4170 RepID=A0A5A7PEG8_STRAF|nr:basic helix-loop-helix (bHLH) DNA-bindingsuperfamily protein [Striga asiatica]